jgi:hypothetical protein
MNEKRTKEELAELFKSKFQEEFDIRILPGKKHLWIAISEKEESDGTNGVRKEDTGTTLSQKEG